MGYSARVLKDSISPNGVRLTTMEITYPRIIHAEMMTHRMFSRNSASSRAVPIKKMLERVEEDCFMPTWWGKTQKGMQAEEELKGYELQKAKEYWLEARKYAVSIVEDLDRIGLHKQITNRLLEPFLWHTAIVTATEWENFFALRRHKDAQPELDAIANMMKVVYDLSEPDELQLGRWHLPLVFDVDTLVSEGYSIDDIKRICVGRCARVSYLTHTGVRDPRADIELCEKLLTSGHMSPFEHCARPMDKEDMKLLARKPGIVGVDLRELDPKSVFSGNFRGWMQMRKELPSEDVFKA